MYYSQSNFTGLHLKSEFEVFKATANKMNVFQSALTSVPQYSAAGNL